MITVFYDGKCSLCSKEINYYKTIANPKKFTWLDVANNPNYLKSIDVNLSDALMQLHVLDNKNNIYVGVDAFIIIWRNVCAVLRKDISSNEDARFCVISACLEKHVRTIF